MEQLRLRRIVIVGSGVVAWLAAAVLARVLKRDRFLLTVLELPSAPTEMYCETADASFRRLVSLLNVDEQEFLRRTQATMNLGTQYVDWRHDGSDCFHGLGPVGAKLEGVAFHHHWLRMRQSGSEVPLDDYSMNARTAKAGRFSLPSADARSMFSLLSYGYHFDTDLLTGYLRDYAIRLGTERADGEIARVRLRGDDGGIGGIQLAGDREVDGDFYIDCSGPNGALMRHLVQGGLRNRDEWLPCPRAVICAGPAPPTAAAHSLATAHTAGWRWRIPTGPRVEHGLAYSPEFLTDDRAAEALAASLPGPTTLAPQIVTFAAGRPNAFWVRNCLTLDANAHVPLAGVRLHLAQTGISRLLTLFPDARPDSSSADEYNRLTVAEHQHVADYLALHFRANERNDSPFWQSCHDGRMSDSLAWKLELYRETGRLAVAEDDYFSMHDWLSAFMRQGVAPRRYDPLADQLNIEATRSALARLSTEIGRAVAELPSHDRFLEQFRGRH